jgi:hypothetical protein
MLRKTLALGAMLALVGVIGCGGTNSVEGEVTLDGTPVSGAVISFVPADGKGQTGSATTDSAGKFTIKGTGNKKGLPSGMYHVILSKGASSIQGYDPEKMKSDKGTMGGDYFKMMEKNKTGGGGPATGPSAAAPKNELPAMYASEKETPFKNVRVPLETRPLKLELKSKK